MAQLVRVIIIVVGLLMLSIGMGFLLTPNRLAAAFYIVPEGVQGLATIRADFPAFFITASLCALYGAWTRRAAPLLVPILLVAIALFGRVVGIILDGIVATTLPPMIAEAAMIGVLAFGYSLFSGGENRQRAKRF
jgi:hypothetical protein